MVVMPPALVSVLGISGSGSDVTVFSASSSNIDSSLLRSVSAVLSGLAACTNGTMPHGPQVRAVHTSNKCHCFTMVFILSYGFRILKVKVINQ